MTSKTPPTNISRTPATPPLTTTAAPATAVTTVTPTLSPLFPADNPAVTAHINLLQGIINRLAGNSSSCKTWCLALVSALLSLAGAMHNPAVAGAALVPVVIFGFVDTMYLAQEKAYRELYGRIVGEVQGKTYGLGDTFNATADHTLGHFFAALVSWSIWPIYGGLLIAYIVAAQRGWLDLLAAAVPAKP